MKIRISTLLIFCLFLTIGNNLKAQVGINTEQPNKLTVLDVKNLTNEAGDVVPQGVMIPRLTEAQRNAIDVTDPSMANSLAIYNTTEDCFNYYSKTNAEWQSICGKLGKAEFSIADCDAIRVGGKGTYFSNEALNSSHYLEVTVHVTKPGSYNIIAKPNPENGYYFTTSGEFLSPGDYTIIVPGAGTPTTPSTEGEAGDLIEVILNGLKTTCQPRIFIIDSTIQPIFTMTCNTGRAAGVYKIGTPLDGTNSITITINGAPEGVGAKSVLKSDVVEGMQFISNPVEIMGGKQTVVLYGTGTPESAGPKSFTITSNSKSSTATCEVTVNVVMKPKIILSIGLNSGYGYNFAYTSTNPGGYAFTHDIRNFGSAPNSIVQIENLVVQGIASGVTMGTLSPYLSGDRKADMIVIDYATDWATNSGVAEALATYVKEGNPLFLMGDNNGGGGADWTQLMNAIFGVSNITVQNTTPIAPGRVYQFTNINHDILNGTFGDLRSQYWGEDASYAQIVLNLPMDDIIVFSDGIDHSTPGYDNSAAQADGVTCFVHRKYPFVFVGDGGFISRSLTRVPAASQNTTCPFLLDSQNYPVPKNNYGTGANKRSVSNSAFFGNVLSWGIRIVEGVIKQE